MNKVKNFLFRLSDGKTQAKAILITFGMLGVGSIAGAYLNPWQLIITMMCAGMCITSYNELKP